MKSLRPFKSLNCKQNILSSKEFSINEKFFICFVYALTKKGKSSFFAVSKGDLFKRLSLLLGGGIKISSMVKNLVDKDVLAIHRINDYSASYVSYNRANGYELSLNRSFYDKIKDENTFKGMRRLIKIIEPIFSNPDLTPREKLISAVIYSLSQKTGSTFATNKYIAEVLGTTEANVKMAVCRLKKKGVILRFKNTVEKKYSSKTKETILKREFVKGSPLEKNERYLSKIEYMEIKELEEEYKRLALINMYIQTAVHYDSEKQYFERI